MASDNVELVKRLMTAFEAGDTEAMLALMDTDVEVVEWPEAPDQKRARGHAGALEILGSWFDAWEWVRVEVDEYLESQDSVVECGTMRAKGKGSEVEVDLGSYNVYTVRDGKVARMQFFIEKEPALQAAGLTEQEEPR